MNTNAHTTRTTTARLASALALLVLVGTACSGNEPADADEALRFPAESAGETEPAPSESSVPAPASNPGTTTSGAGSGSSGPAKNEPTGDKDVNDDDANDDDAEPPAPQVISAAITHVAPGGQCTVNGKIYVVGGDPEADYPRIVHYEWRIYGQAPQTGQVKIESPGEASVTGVLEPSQDRVTLRTTFPHEVSTGVDYECIELGIAG